MTSVTILSQENTSLPFLKLFLLLKTLLAFFHRLLKTFLQQTNFSGASGRVIFRDGERYLPTVEMEQRFPARVVKVGRVLPNMYKACGSSNRCLEMNETSILWPEGKRPTDGRSSECMQLHGNS